MSEQTTQPQEETQVQEPQEGTFVAPPMDVYEFDWDKVTTLEEIKLVFKAMGIKFTAQVPNFEELKPFAKKVN